MYQNYLGFSRSQSCSHMLKFCIKYSLGQGPILLRPTGSQVSASSLSCDGYFSLTQYDSMIQYWSYRNANYLLS